MYAYFGQQRPRAAYAAAILLICGARMLIASYFLNRRRPSATLLYAMSSPLNVIAWISLGLGSHFGSRGCGFNTVEQTLATGSSGSRPEDGAWGDCRARSGSSRISSPGQKAATRRRPNTYLPRFACTNP